MCLTPLPYPQNQADSSYARHRLRERHNAYPHIVSPPTNQADGRGHMATALDGAGELHDLSLSVPPHLTILPASGINAATLPALLAIAPRLREAHLSASGAYMPPSTPAAARGEVLGFGRDEWRLDPEKLRAVRHWVDQCT